MKSFALSLLISISLVLQISAQSLLKDGKIPDDFVITIYQGGTVQFATYYYFKITSDGKVFYEEFDRSLPKGRNFLELLSLQPGKKVAKPPKPVKLKDKLSKKQLKQIILEVEKSKILEITENEQCQTIIDHYTTRGISITVSGETKGIEEIKLRCDNNESQRLKNFVSLYDFISKEISGVKKNKLTK